MPVRIWPSLERTGRPGTCWPYLTTTMSLYICLSSFFVTSRLYGGGSSSYVSKDSSFSRTVKGSSSDYRGNNLLDSKGNRRAKRSHAAILQQHCPLPQEKGDCPRQLTFGRGCSSDEPAALVVTVRAATIGCTRAARRAGTALVLRALENIVKVYQLLLRC